MTPQEMEKEIIELKRQMKLLKSTSTIPFEIEKAFEDRLDIRKFIKPLISAKLANSENQAVDEAGAGTYNVLGNPTGFVVMTLSGTDTYIPYFSV